MYTLLPCNLSYIVQLYRVWNQCIPLIVIQVMVLTIALFMYACMYSMRVVNVHDQACIHSNCDVDSWHCKQLIIDKIRYIHFQ